MAHSVYETPTLSKVVAFGTNRKRVYDFPIGPSNLGPILPRFRDIRAFLFAESHFFHTPPLFQLKFRGVPSEVSAMMESAENDHP